jgi:hypothetical protein
MKTTYWILILVALFLLWQWSKQTVTTGIGGTVPAGGGKAVAEK